MAFADQLRELMNKRNMKAVELARAAGLSEAAISDYLNGKKEPRGRQSVAIAKALAVSLDTLWETDFQDKGPVNERGTADSGSARLDDASEILSTLSPEFQDCAIAQIKNLAELNVQG